MTQKQFHKTITDRPVVYDYGQPHQFLSDLLSHYKRNGNFSLRQRTAKSGLCSQALVSHVLSGRRKLTHDNLSEISEVFKLTQYSGSQGTTSSAFALKLVPKMSPHIQ